ncbi:hypothetical protein F0562_019914 [Nyssa sinensis]|uniref:pectinesterase n=1 Tax=Nyssa sinensis TaxID=561372 RepID=A0A5J5BTS7_9ASTE|nr:hypothetical protein F0562_019914 [Nyssa sinensis]
MGEDGRKRTNRIAIIGVSSLILVAMVVALTVGIDNLNGSSSKKLNHEDVSASVKAVETICQPTTYKEVCVNSLSSVSGNTTDPKELIKMGFQVAKNHIKEAAKNSTVLQELQNDPRTKKALNDCQELAEYAMNDLERSFDQLGDLDISKIEDFVDNLRTWLSGAITHQETCLDGFENTTGEAGEKMKKLLETSMQMTSNALSMVTEVSRALQSLDLSSLDVSARSRRLLSEELPVLGHGEMLPSWSNPGMRRLLTARPHEIKPDLIIAKDGSGKYKTINEALEDIPKKNDKTFVIYIKEGVYEEKVQFNRSMTHLMIMGDGPTKTRITGRLNFIEGTPTFHTATVAALGDHFIARDIGFENYAGPDMHQAVALRVGADMSIFYNCHMDGYQDTLYAHAYRQFYRDCRITGTIDFLFGDSSALFQNCTMLVRKPLANQQCIVTAQGRKEKNQPSGLVLQNCTITADPSYHPNKSTLKSYLGRPWKQFSRTVIMESYIDDLISARRGPASPKQNRVRWRGVKNMTSARIQRYTAAVFIGGNSWIPQTGVPYTAGLVYPAPNDNSILPPPKKKKDVENEEDEDEDEDKHKKDKDKEDDGEKEKHKKKMKSDHDDDKVVMEGTDSYYPAPAPAPGAGPALSPAPAPTPSVVFPAIASPATNTNLPSKPNFIDSFKTFFRG